MARLCFLECGRGVRELLLQVRARGAFELDERLALMALVGAIQNVRRLLMHAGTVDRPSDDDWQIAEQGLILCEVFVSLQLECFELWAGALRHDDNDQGVGRKIPHLLENGAPACPIDLGLHDQRGEVRILINPSCGVIEARRPRNRDIPCNTSQSCGDSLSVSPFASNVENLHAARRSCGNRPSLSIGQTAVRLHCGAVRDANPIRELRRSRL